MHLALLEGLSSSKAGLGAGRVHEMQKSLSELSESIQRQVDADEEINELLRNSGEPERIKDADGG